jgi:hypothetical protein
MTAETPKMTALTPAQAARILSAAYRRRITEEQVRQVAEDGQLLRADGTFSLIEYVAYLAGEVVSARD